MVKKKVTKKKLKEPDEFIHFTEKAYLYISHHLKHISIGGILIIIILLSLFFYQRWQKGNEEEAYQQYHLAVEGYQAVSSPRREGSTSEYKKILEKFNEVITKFPKTSASKFSFLYKGNIYLRLDEFEEAIKAYQVFLQKAGKERLYQLFAHEGLGYAYEGKKEYEKAVNSYQKMIEMGEGFHLSGAYLGLGRCYEKLGKKKEALENYKTFLKLSQKSQMANIVLKKISSLEN